MPPMYGPRGTQVARTLGALTTLGWQTTVVCLDPKRGGPHWRESVDVTLPAGVEAWRVKSPEEWMIVRAARRLVPALRDRPDPQWVWIGRATAAATAASSRTRFDGLVTFAQPWSDHLIGLRVHRATKLPWVAHFSDPWVDDPYLRLSNERRDALLRMETDVVAAASAIVFVSDEAADLVMAKYPREWRRKAAVVPHGFHAAPALKGPAHDAERGLPAVALAKAGPMRLVYTGRFYDGLRTPLPLLRALAQVNSRQPLAGVLAVTLVGPHTTRYTSDVGALGLTAVVHLHDRVSNSDAAAMASRADALLVIDAPTAIPSPYLPSKLVDYLPLRKPLLGITPAKGASAALLARLGETIASPDDVDGIASAISNLLRRWRDGTLEVGPGFDRVASEYDITRTTAAFSDVLTRAFAVRAS
jgi:hypothetical protein